MSQETTPEAKKTEQPARILVGHCPQCGDPVLIQNNFEMWPLVYCRCGFVGDTWSIVNRVRIENYWQISDKGSNTTEQRRPGSVSAD
jgi:endogenous inhibitor of DNA gyrase (YacG/DUF329 family)